MLVSAGTTDFELGRGTALYGAICRRRTGSTLIKAGRHGASSGGPAPAVMASGLTRVNEESTPAGEIASLWQLLGFEANVLQDDPGLPER
jgi:hypothetical protein